MDAGVDLCEHRVLGAGCTATYRKGRQGESDRGTEEGRKGEKREGGEGRKRRRVREREGEREGVGGRERGRE